MASISSGDSIIFTKPSTLTIDVPRPHSTFEGGLAPSRLVEDIDCDADSLLISVFQRRFFNESIFPGLKVMKFKKKQLNTSSFRLNEDW
jgi:hypothetical protein